VLRKPTFRGLLATDHAIDRMEEQVDQSLLALNALLLRDMLDERH
jgi:hypothetical protein